MSAVPKPTQRPADSDFYQQRLKAWQPILTPTWVIVTFLLIGLPFIGIGAGLKYVSDQVVEYSVQYDGAGADPKTADCAISSGAMPGACTVTFTVTTAMKGPVYLYYQIDNFYQNHRRYVKSRSDTQLAGTIYTSASQVSSDCDPLSTNAAGQVLDPCGLVANSMFNDTFSLVSNTGSNPAVQVLETGISWTSDAKKFVAISPAVQANYPTVSFINNTYPNITDVSNEHFMVWMRVAALPSFRKLYGRITTDIAAGDSLTFVIRTNFPVSSFSGKKYIVLSTTSFLGGKNPFLGYAYIIVGAICVALAVAFALRQYFGGRSLGDTSLLVWKR